MADQFPEATKMVLSPAAQAVLDAADSAFEQAGTTRQGIAAALRAATDQVMPGRPHPHRAQLLAIAAELDSNSTHK